MIINKNESYKDCEAIFIWSKNKKKFLEKDNGN